MRFSSVNLSESKLKNLNLLDCEFIKCELTACKSEGASWHKVQLINSRCTGSQLQLSNLKNVVFNNVNFESCILDGAEFSSSTLSKVDFRSSEISRIKGLSSIVGSIIDPTQLISIAPALADQLNIIVE